MNIVSNSYLVKRREYLGKVFTLFGYRSCYDDWRTVQSFDTLQEAEDYVWDQHGRSGLWVYSVFHKGKKI